MVDINTRLSNGTRHRERRRLSIASKSAAQRWGQDRERHLLQHGPPQVKKEVVEEKKKDNPVPEKYRAIDKTPYRVEVKPDVRNRFEFKLED